MIIIALIFFLFFTCGTCLTALLIIGYREQVRKAVEAANTNAGYWAESESKLHDAQITIAALDASLKSEAEHRAEISRITHAALGIAHREAFKEGCQHEFIEPSPLAHNTTACDRGRNCDEWPEEIE